MERAKGFEPSTSTLARLRSTRLSYARFRLTEKQITGISHKCKLCFCKKRRWLRKTPNRDIFRGPTNVQRVKEWRKAHPGYWRKKSALQNGTQATYIQHYKPASPLVTHLRPCNVRYKMSASQMTLLLSG